MSKSGSKSKKKSIIFRTFLIFFFVPSSRIRIENAASAETERDKRPRQRERERERLEQVEVGVP